MQHVLYPHACVALGTYSRPLAALIKWLSGKASGKDKNVVQLKRRPISCKAAKMFAKEVNEVSNLRGTYRSRLHTVFDISEMCV